MAQVSEGFEQFLFRIARRTVARLLADEDILIPPRLRELEG
jgi:hypothetical protein